MELQILLNQLSTSVERLRELSNASQLSEAERAEKTRLTSEVHGLNQAIRKATERGAGQRVTRSGGQYAPPRQGFHYESVFQSAEILEGGQGGLQVLEPDQSFVGEQADAPEFSFGEMLQNFLGVQTNHSAEIREAINSGSDAAGGLFIQPSVGDRVIDLARSPMAYTRAGGRFAPMTVPRLVIGVQTADPTPHWRTEGTAVDPSAPTFSKIEVVPKFLGCVVTVTDEWLSDVQNGGALIETAVANAMAAAMDAAALSGTGSNGEPQGIRGTTGVLTADMSGAPKYAMPSTAVQQILTANFPGDPSDLAWIHHPRDGGVFDRLTDTTGQPLQPSRWAADLQKYATTGMPINNGVGEDLGSHLFGFFPAAVMFIRRGLKIEVLREGTVVNKLLEAQDYLGSEWKYAIRASIRADIVVEKPGWFAAGDDFDPAGTDA